jgi:hypothetical protein
MHILIILITLLTDIKHEIYCFSDYFIKKTEPTKLQQNRCFTDAKQKIIDFKMKKENVSIKKFKNIRNILP